MDDEDRRRRQAPSEKKQRDLERHAHEAEYPHGFRKSWPRKKAKVSRDHRRRVRQAAHDASKIDIDDSFDAPTLEEKKRSPVKWGTMETLREKIAGRLFGRRRRLGWNYFKDPYSSQLHRERFTAFAEALISEKAAAASDNAAIVRTWFSSKEVYAASVIARWLEAYAQDEPEMYQRLKCWAFDHNID